MKEWFKLPAKERKTIISQVAVRKGLLPAAVEKDWWVMLAMRAIFNNEYSNQFVFKGGTSLSKAWNIIERFSEDIDLAIDREFFGYGGDLSRKKVTKLRKASCAFVVDTFQHTLAAKLEEEGVKEFSVNVVDFERSDTDPLAIELNYVSLTEKVDYLKPRILIELSSRSLIHPFENRDMISFIGETYPDLPFADTSMKVPTVLAARTMLEKIFLLHEEFQREPRNEIRSERMTRHLYDLWKLLNTDNLEDILKDKELYETIVANRQMLLNITWVDYEKHQPSYINIIPPDEITNDYKEDYDKMKESMIYGDTGSYEELISELYTLKSKINSINWN